MSEFTYFADPQTDRVVAFAWQLAQELAVTRARVTALEQSLVAAGVIPADAIENHRPDAAQQEVLAADRDEYTDRLMRVLTETDDHNAPIREQFPTLKRA